MQSLRTDRFTTLAGKPEENRLSVRIPERHLLGLRLVCPLPTALRSHVDASPHTSPNRLRSVHSRANNIMTNTNQAMLSANEIR